VASILAAFDAGKVVGNDGVHITPREEYTDSMIRKPKPFQFTLSPRSKNSENLIREAVEAAA